MFHRQKLFETFFMLLLYTTIILRKLISNYEKNFENKKIFICNMVLVLCYLVRKFCIQQY